MNQTEIADRTTDKPTATVRISKSFTIVPDVTSRTAAIADAFGVGVDVEQENILYAETPITFARGDVVYITGESGGGKSVLFRELKQIFGSRKVVDANDIEIDPNIPLVEQPCFTSLEHATGTLAQVGLGDAYLFLGRYNNLSDGQKFRARLAMLLASDADVWTCDEFTSALDRETAHVVAYTFQKAARRRGVTLIVATAHTDLAEPLGPDVLIHKNFGPTVKVSYPEDEPRLGVRDRLVFQRVHPKDDGGLKRYYDSDLAHFHYRGHKVGGPREIIFAYDPVEDRDVGVIVGTVPAFENANRSALTDKAYVRNPKLVNRDIICISRVVVLPKYRSVGLGSGLVEEFLRTTEYPYVETLAEMAKTNPFFEKAGMTMADDVGGPRDKRFRIKTQLVEELGADPWLVRSVKYMTGFLDELRTFKSDTYELLLTQAYPFVNAHFVRYGGKGSRPDWASDKFAWATTDLQNQATGLVKIFSPRPAYLYWWRPGWTPPPGRSTTKGLGSHG
jgi:ABC-type transport system involved in cytochrome c biogenesis ATPase subunit/GNAT superfamily N-acetyltransferase